MIIAKGPAPRSYAPSKSEAGTFQCTMSLRLPMVKANLRWMWQFYHTACNHIRFCCLLKVVCYSLYRLMHDEHQRRMSQPRNGRWNASWTALECGMWTA